MNPRDKMIWLSSSYFLRLPEEIIEQHEGRVSSFWKDGEGILLQVSSYRRLEGCQVPAKTRIDELLNRESLHIITKSMPVQVDCPDWATVWASDSDGIYWFYGYAVWPDLCIMLSVSGVPKELNETNSDNWAFNAIRSIQRGERMESGLS
jgi:hypothetical protein